MTELLACPFCGGEAHLQPEVFDTCNAFVQCKRCEVVGPDSVIDNHARGMTSAEAVAAWNRRALTASQAQPEVTARDEAQCLIREERARQIAAEGWSREHDDQHINGELLHAAVIYLHCDPDNPLATPMNGNMPMGWPWDAKWWKPKDRRSNLIRAGALCLAEVERLARVGRSTLHATNKFNLAVTKLAALLPAKAAEPVAWQKNADETARLITKALAERTPVLGGPEGETILAYSIPSGLWLMLQAEVRLLLDKLYATPPSSPVMVVGEGFDGEDLRLLRNIRWSSADKDNMEFTTRASCYQVEALNRLLAAASPAQATEGKDG